MPSGKRVRESQGQSSQEGYHTETYGGTVKKRQAQKADRWEMNKDRWTNLVGKVARPVFSFEASSAALLAGVAPAARSISRRVEAYCRQQLSLTGDQFLRSYPGQG